MISAIVLAAGNSSRMGEPKALVSIGGQPLLRRVLAAVRASPARDVVVVLGHEAERVRDEVSLDGTRIVVNSAFAEGMSTSIRAGLAAADSRAEGYLIVLGDQPFVAPTTMEALINARSTSNAKIMIPTFRGVRGNPVLVDRSLAGEVAAVTGDQGCRAIFGHHGAEILEVAVDDPGILVDIDTPSQAERAGRALASGDPLESLVPEADAVPHHGRMHDRPPRRSALDVLSLAADLSARGEPFVIATVVRAVRPTSGKPGAKAIVRPDRVVIGWVGGSCAQTAVLAESLAALRDGRPRLLRLSREAGHGSTEDGVVEYVMECHSGGAIDIYIEPNLPRPRLVLVGDSPVVETLAAMGRILSYRVLVVAPGLPAEAIPEADEVLTNLESLAAVVSPDTYAVVATMGKYDEFALQILAPSRARYVGLVASRRRAAVVREALLGKGLLRETVDRIQNPAGMDISAHTPEEIALSVMAEVTRTRRGGEPVPRLHEEPAVPSEKAPIQDVVCGMEVGEGTPLTATYAGVVYRFCSEGCRSRFLAGPEKFLQ